MPGPADSNTFDGGARGARSLLSRMLRDEAGVSVVEFAMVLPVFMMLGLYGFDIAFLASQKMQVSQLTLSVADNASRLGQTDNNAVAPTITEDQVDVVLKGALKQAGQLDIENNGRIILSSLEYDPVTDRQFIHWQRCIGAKSVTSAYGNDSTNNGMTGTKMTGMGSGSNRVAAPTDTAVMFVEIVYDHPSVFPGFMSGPTELREEAAFIVRDDRDLQDPDEKGLTGTKKNACS
ncbi:MAG: pilus assembly protein TadE [Sphingomonadales bacterium CG12_big_fil_rev_8_21_14_0_65_65_10]|nr:MAG: pilus assembly protein TadE [Sphingomonadales bacterium CG12_big_fil_rev_8_21_14_0_65_65_10]